MEILEKGKVTNTHLTYIYFFAILWLKNLKKVSHYLYPKGGTLKKVSHYLYPKGGALKKVSHYLYPKGGALKYGEAKTSLF